MRPGFIPEAISFWTDNKEELNELKRRVGRLLAKGILSGEVDPWRHHFVPTGSFATYSRWSKIDRDQSR
jgi:hypothetical protein